MTKLIIALSLTCAATMAAPVGVDGLLGAEWTGFTPVTVTYNAAAPINNFGAPTNENHLVAYRIFSRLDAGFLYALILADPVSGDGWTGGGAVDFANIYIDTNPVSGSGSDLGIEVTNDRAFRPGVPGYTPSLVAQGFAFSIAIGTPTVGTGIEFALPISYLINDPHGLGFPLLPDSRVRINLSQSFGYSVAGGASFYGADRLGAFDVVPEPSTWALLATGLAFAAAARRRARTN